MTWHTTGKRGEQHVIPISGMSSSMDFDDPLDIVFSHIYISRIRTSNTDRLKSLSKRVSLLACYVE